jgi:hypothetical protein
LRKSILEGDFYKKQSGAEVDWSGYAKRKPKLDGAVELSVCRVFFTDSQIGLPQILFPIGLPKTGHASIIDEVVNTDPRFEWLSCLSTEWPLYGVIEELNRNEWQDVPSKPKGADLSQVLSTPPASLNRTIKLFQRLRLHTHLPCY